MKVGDKVKINSDIKEGHTYKIYCSPEMEQLRGKIFTISYISTREYFVETIIRVKGIDDWHWSTDMFIMYRPNNVIGGKIK